MFSKNIFIKFVIPIILLCISLFLPLCNHAFDLQNLLNIVSLLFVIILGFFIAAATSNYLNFQSLLAEEDGALISLCNIVKLTEPSSKDKITKLIDQYVINTLDYKLGEYIDYTQKDYDQIIKMVDEIKIDQKNPESSALFPYMHEVKANLFKVRGNIALSAKRVVHGIHWTILILLSLIIEFLLLSIRNGSFSISAITGIITIILYLTLILLYEIDNNVFLEKQLAFQNPQRLFQAIGELPYYPEIAIKKHLIKKPTGKYRIGIYKDYPKSFDKTIEIIEK